MTPQVVPPVVSYYIRPQLLETYHNLTQPLPFAVDPHGLVTSLLDILILLDQVEDPPVVVFPVHRLNNPRPGSPSVLHPLGFASSVSYIPIVLAKVRD